MNIKKSDMEELRQNIIRLTQEKILNNGFYKFSMDELANELNISKKIIYRVFPSKENLIQAVFTLFLNNAYRTIISVAQAKTNIVEKFITFSVIVEHYYKIFNENSLANLKKYFPGLANSIEAFRNSRVIPIVKVLLRIGRKKKLILNIPDDIILKVFTSALGSIAASKPENFTLYSYLETFRYSFNLLLNGILTKKGKQILNYKIYEKKRVDAMRG